MKIDIVERLRSVNGETAPYANEVVRALCHEAAEHIEQLRIERLKVDRRIHNQRVALRMNWEIMEMRAQNRPILSKDVRSRRLAAWGQAQRRAWEAEARIKRLEEALSLIDALDPESLIDGCTIYALRGLVLRMGGIARAALEDK